MGEAPSFTIEIAVAVCAVLVHVALSDILIKRVLTYYVDTGWFHGRQLTEVVHFRMASVFPQIVLDTVFVIAIDIVCGWGIIAGALAAIVFCICRLMLFLAIITRAKRRMAGWRMLHFMAASLVCYVPAIFAAGMNGQDWSSKIFHW